MNGYRREYVPQLDYNSRRHLNTHPTRPDAHDRVSTNKSYTQPETRDRVSTNNGYTQPETHDRLSTNKVYTQPETRDRVSTNNGYTQPETHDRVSTNKVYTQPETRDRVSTNNGYTQLETRDRVSTNNTYAQPETHDRVSTNKGYTQPETRDRVSTNNGYTQPETRARVSTNRMYTQPETRDYHSKSSVNCDPDHLQKLIGGIHVDDGKQLHIDHRLNSATSHMSGQRCYPSAPSEHSGIVSDNDRTNVHEATRQPSQYSNMMNDNGITNAHETMYQPFSDVYIADEVTKHRAKQHQESDAWNQDWENSQLVYLEDVNDDTRLYAQWFLVNKEHLPPGAEYVIRPTGRKFSQKEMVERLPHIMYDLQQWITNKNDLNDNYIIRVTYLLRNMSDLAEREYRMKMRGCSGVINMLCDLLTAAANDMTIGEQAAENCAKALQNISYGYQEILEHEFMTRQDQEARTYAKDLPSTILSPTKRKHRKSLSFSIRGSYLDEKYTRLWDDEMMDSYSKVFQSDNQGAIEGVLGIYQNLTSCDWQYAHVFREKVRQWKQLPVLVTGLLVTYNNKGHHQMLAMVVSVLWNLSEDIRHKDFIATYVPQYIVKCIPDNHTLCHEQCDSVRLIFALIIKLIDNESSVKDLWSRGTLNRLDYIAHEDVPWCIRKYYSMLLQMLWSYDNLHVMYKAGAWHKQKFLYEPNAPISPLDNNGLMPLPRVSFCDAQHNSRHLIAAVVQASAPPVDAMNDYHTAHGPNHAQPESVSNTSPESPSSHDHSWSRDDTLPPDYAEIEHPPRYEDIIGKYEQIVQEST